MAARNRVPKYGNGAVPDPYGQSFYMQGHVGTTATWQCCTENFPKFQLNFGATNPFNNKPKATFNGAAKKPIALVLKRPGIYEYTIKHIKADGAEMVVGPYCINVAPPPTFLIPPRKCPPECGAGHF